MTPPNPRPAAAWQEIVAVGFVVLACGLAAAVVIVAWRLA